MSTLVLRDRKHKGQEATLGSSSDERLAFEVNDGVILEDRYQIVRGIGGGGMGQVYEARHLRLGHRVAVKFLLATHAQSETRRRRFEREARAAAQLQHENVVRVFDFGVGPSGAPYLVMEYLEGCDMRSLLCSEGSLAAPRAVRLMLDVCAGLAVAHGADVVHRDLKPENLFVTRSASGSERCKILDFGLAKVLNEASPDFRTKAGAPLGTVHYMSPEQARGASDIDARSDIYSLCAILYELLSGQRAHRGSSEHALIYNIAHEPISQLSEICDFVPTQLADIVHRGLEKDRLRRIQSVESLAKALGSFAGTPATEAAGRSRHGSAFPTQTSPAPEESTARRKMSKSSLTAVILFTATLVLLAAWKAGTHESPSSTATGPRLPAIDQAKAEPSEASRPSELPPTLLKVDTVTLDPPAPTSAQPRVAEPARPVRSAALKTAASAAPASVRSSTQFDRANPYQ